MTHDKHLQSQNAKNEDTDGPIALFPWFSLKLKHSAIFPSIHNNISLFN